MYTRHGHMGFLFYGYDLIGVDVFFSFIGCTLPDWSNTGVFEVTRDKIGGSLV